MILRITTISLLTILAAGLSRSGHCEDPPETSPVEGPSTAKPAAADVATSIILGSWPVKALDLEAAEALEHEDYAGWRSEVIAQLADDQHPTSPTLLMLFAAAWTGDRQLVHLLAEKGLGIDERDPVMGHTALHLATLDGQTTAVATLLEFKADPNTVSIQSGATPLGDAVNLNWVELARLLLRGGADPNQRGVNFGMTPLHSAVQDGHTTLTQLLLDHEADPNLGNHRGVTPLHIAITSRQVDCIRLLLEAGADPNAATEAGTTPLKIARRNQLTEIEALLMKHGAK